MQTVFVYQKLISRVLAARTEKNSRYSLRAFARSLAIDSGALSQILSGKRVPSRKVADKLLRRLELGPEDTKAFWISLAQCQMQRGLRRTNPFLREVLKTTQKSAIETSPRAELNAEAFRVIADWHHMAILELTFVKGFSPSPRWIAARLGISPAQAKLALARLNELGLLTATPKGNLVKTNRHITTSDKSTTSAAHRRRHKQILEKSIESMENDPLEIRNHTAMTMAIDVTRISEAKTRIQIFMRELCQFLESGKQTEVYELTVNLFPLSGQKTKKKEKSP